MIPYRYIAVRSDGTRVESRESAESADQLRARLEAQGLTVESIEAVDSTEAVAGADAADAHEGGEPRAEADEPAAAGARLSETESQRLAGDLSDLMRSGLPLAQGLLALSREMPRGRYRRTLERMVEQLERGESLETVLQQQRAPRDLVALIRATQLCGHSMELLEQYSSQMRSRMLFRNQFFLALTYPVFLTVAVAAIFVFLLTWIVPQFRLLFEDFGVQLPAMTRCLIFLSDVLVEDWYYVAGAVLLVAAAVFAMLRFRMQRLARRRLLWTVPVIGARVRWLNLSQFARVLSILIRQRIALPEALLLAGDSTNDACIEVAAAEMSEAVQRGEGLESRQLKVRDFPAHFLSLLTVGDQQLPLADTLEELGTAYEERAQIQAPLIAVFVEPIFVFLAGCLVGFVVLSLFAPLLMLLNALS